MNRDDLTNKDYSCPGHGSTSLESKNQFRTIAGGHLELRTRGSRSRQLSHLDAKIYAKSLKARERRLEMVAAPHDLLQ